MSPLVTPAMLAAVRNVGNRGLESSAVIMRSIQVENDFGSEAQWATVATDVPCWVRNISLTPGITDTSMRESIVNTFRIHFTQGTDIQPGDRVIVDDSTYTLNDTNTENTLQVFSTALAKKVE